MGSTSGDGSYGHKFHTFFRRPRTSGPGCICVVRLERTARENALAGSAHLRPWHRHNHLRIPSPDQRHVRGEVSFVGRGPGEARSMAPAALAKNYAWFDRRGAGIVALSFTANGFGNFFRDAVESAGLRGLSAHGLRKAACRRLAEAGCSAHEIMSISGHISLREVQRYTMAANREQMARSAFQKLGTSQNKNSQT